MLIFIYEFICGGGLASRPLPESLAREGWAMLGSIVEDFARVKGVEVVTTLDERFRDRPLSARCEFISNDGDEWATIERLARDADWTMLIAPESGGVLFDRASWAESAGGRLLGPAPAGIALASDKFACSRRLRDAGVRAAVGELVPIERGPPRGCEFPVVLKPRDGAGSQHTFLIRDETELTRALGELRADRAAGDLLLEPFVPGVPASVAFLVGPAGATPLLPARQLLSRDGRLRYLGGRIPLGDFLADRAVALARRAVASVPGLRGYVGVDLVLGATGDAASRAEQEEVQSENCKLQIANCPTDTVIEINPRLTTSYVGLRQLAESNLPEHLLATVSGRDIGPIRWRGGAVRFHSDGRIG